MIYWINLIFFFGFAYFLNKDFPSETTEEGRRDRQVTINVYMGMGVLNLLGILL